MEDRFLILNHLDRAYTLLSGEKQTRGVMLALLSLEQVYTLLGEFDAVKAKPRSRDVQV